MRSVKIAAVIIVVVVIVVVVVVAVVVVVVTIIRGVVLDISFTNLYTNVGKQTTTPMHKRKASCPRMKRNSFHKEDTLLSVQK